MRERRNDLADEASSYISWHKLEDDVDIIQVTLSHLGLVGARPHFNVKAERSAAQKSDEPGISWFHEYSIAVLEGEKRAGEITWRVKVHDDEAS